MITKETWLLAQKLERMYHHSSLDEAVQLYERVYKTNLFKYLLIDYENMEGRSILEIGCADVPALYFCNNIIGYVIEPMDSPTLNELSDKKPFTIIQGPAEEVAFPQVEETWMFNLLTHVISPDVIIAKAKAFSNTIRFFEPVNTPVDTCHPWSLSLEYYIEKFGDCVQYYPSNPTIKNFHAHECAYGIWRRPNVQA
jgi:hypothetical protein